MNTLKTLLLTLALAPVVPLAACGGDSFASVQEDTLDVMEQAADILEGVTDVASAKAARGRIEALAKKSAALRARFESLEPGQVEEPGTEHDERAEKIGMRMMESMERLADQPEVLEILDESMRSLR